MTQAGSLKLFKFLPWNSTLAGRRTSPSSSTSFPSRFTTPPSAPALSAALLLPLPLALSGDPPRLLVLRALTLLVPPLLERLLLLDLLEGPLRDGLLDELLLAPLLPYDILEA